jgi:drug/metabolite transporter (DMT)-like permease
MSGVRATLIYALEPAWTGLFGYLVGERLGMLAWVGCICILFAMIVGSIRFDLVAKRRKRA